jgi:pimeloyl-ACP methyl ester carboxylesterase
VTDQRAHGHAAVNGLRTYYETHGAGRPPVLLPGALAAIGTSFGGVPPPLAKTRRAIAVEPLAHGRTADVDRPLTDERLADDVAALPKQLGSGRADLLGRSPGAVVATRLAIAHPDLVRALVLASPAHGRDGSHPGLLDAAESATPADLVGSPWQQEDARIAPHPEGWPRPVAEVTQHDRERVGRPQGALRAITAPTPLGLGDADIVRPEHAVERFRLRGGGVAGDLAGLPRARLAGLPATTHVTLVDRADWLVPMLTEFLDAPPPEAA